MKALFTAVAAFCVATAAFSGTSMTNRVDAKTRAERRAMAQKERLESTGGEILRRDALKGRAIVFNAQKSVSTEFLKTATAHVFKRMHIFNECKDIGDVVDISSVDGLLNKYEAKVGVFVVEDEKLKAPMLIAPESRWAIVNVARIKEGDPKPVFVQARTGKEVVRAILYVCGAANSIYPDSLMKYVGKMNDLDDYPNFNPPMDVMNRMKAYLTDVGITMRPMTTYREACQEGWAPQPTNDIQRAIWSDVHKLPDKPIKIEYKSKKGN